jgi:hypothetical protein
MSYAGLLLALAAGIASYLPYVPGHYTTAVAGVGALLAALGESILKPPVPKPPVA